MDHAKQGAAALASSDANKAVEEYTQALIEHPTSPDYYTQRSIALTRTKPPRHDLALQDAEYGVLCGQKRGKRDKIQAAQQRRVVAYYNLGKYADAKLVLDSMKRWRPENSKPQEMEHSMWATKIDGKLKVNPQEPSTSEYPTITLPDEKVLKKQLEEQLKKDGTFNHENEQTEASEDIQPATSNIVSTSPSQAPTVSASIPNSTTSAPVVPQKIRHEMYQNSQNVIITIYAKGVPKDKAEVDIEDDSVSVTFPQPGDPSSTFNLTFDPLFALIDSTKSKFQIMSTKVELTLAKSVQGQKWPSIEGSEPLKKTSNGDASGDLAKAAVFSSVQQPSTTTSGPSYPTSSKNGPKNWDKLASDLTAKKGKKSQKDAKKDGSDSEGAGDEEYDSDTGGDAVDGFFKKLYAGADPDTRRAMMKSFQESNGTSLSTNWQDVGSRHVDEVQSKDDD